MLNKIIRYFLDNKLVTSLVIMLFVAWGISHAPFGWESDFLPTDPVPVDAIPDIGENQQIVFTQWMGRSPQDIEDQISYPLTTSLLGIPGVKSIRSQSIFGFSSIYIIFKEEVDFYWSRSRILEKLNSLPANLLPSEVRPALGPDATALGQVYWYTIEGRDPEGNPTGGWDLHDVRTYQDFYVKYSLNAVDGVSEVASIGGYVKEYQVDVDPDALKIYDIPLFKVMDAVRKSNRDVGAKTIEVNQAEYLVRGLGYIKSVEDLEKAVVAVHDNVPITIKDIGVVSLGPATRRGILDKDGAEVVGGVVIARYGSNPLAVINNVKDKIAEIAEGMPKKTLEDGTESQLTIVPFYDRTKLINETLGTLEEALTLEILITILVVIIMVLNLRASILISSILPISVLMVFIAMKYFHVDANIVALSGIAIAIGTMVDLGVILAENIIKHLHEAHPGQSIKEIIYNASVEVSSAIVTAVSTTVVSFVPVFAMEAAEGKLFRPLAFTKTFALISALLVTLFILPTVAQWFFGVKVTKNTKGKLWNGFLILVGLVTAIWVNTWAGVTIMALAGAWFVRNFTPKKMWITDNLSIIISVVSVAYLLANFWMPLGAGKSLALNFIFVGILLVIILGTFILIEHSYPKILGFCLNHKLIFLSIPFVIIMFGSSIWMGFNTTFGFVANGFEAVGINIKTTKIWSGLSHSLPGLGKEFMPSLDEGSFLLMPTSMPHSGIEANLTIVKQLDMLLVNIPEVELSVGKAGRVESALDPAPISMFENLINYKPEYKVDKKGHREKFKVDDDDKFIISSGGSYTNEEILTKNIDTSELIADDDGRYFRNWRKEINSPGDIWNEIVKVTKIPGVTSAPKLMPIETRLIMLQTGMRAPMGIKVFGPDLGTIEDFGLELEEILQEIPSVKAEAVFADRIVGKPYIHLNIDREAISRYGLNVEDMQMVIETAIGGIQITTTVEGRERFPVRVRYPRELRDNPDALKKIYIPTPTGAQVPLVELVDIEYYQGPQIIKSEDTFLVGYVLLDKMDGYAEVDVVEAAQVYIQNKIDKGELVVPAGLSYKFTGNYENQIRAEKRLAIIVPVVLLTIFLILYFQFKSVSTSLMVFTGIALAFSGAFLMLWLYGQDWFFNFSFFDTNMRELFQMHTVNLSVAVWVGFIALFGIATDDGVLIGTFLDQSFERSKPKTIKEVREAVLKAGLRRIKPALMTVATTIIALLPILSSTGRGSDIMIPMAIPSFGGMCIALISIFVVPVLYSFREERKITKAQGDAK
jgi:copper/silver efflux system protein